MRRSSFYILFATASILFAMACTKDHTCDCTIVENNETNNTSFSLEGFTGNDAVDECDSKERFTADSVNIKCELR